MRDILFHGNIRARQPGLRVERDVFGGQFSREPFGPKIFVGVSSLQIKIHDILGGGGGRDVKGQRQRASACGEDYIMWEWTGEKGSVMGLLGCLI